MLMSGLNEPILTKVIKANYHAIKLGGKEVKVNYVLCMFVSYPSILIWTYMICIFIF